MAKEQWKKCSRCGAITDVDEKECPNRGLNNPRHYLRKVKLGDEEVKALWKERKLWTKHIAALEDKLSRLLK